MKHINRRVILKKRNRISKKEIIEKSKAIKEKLFNSEEYKRAKTVMFYVSFGSEVYTWGMIKEALRNKTVCVPVVKDNKKIIASVISSFKDLDKRGAFGILEPSRIKEIGKKDIDLIIVPGVVFDKKGCRIGYGRGYYDDFLIDYKGNKIGVAFKMQVLEIIPSYKCDITVDRVITES